MSLDLIQVSAISWTKHSYSCHCYLTISGRTRFSYCRPILLSNFWKGSTSGCFFCALPPVELAGGIPWPKPLMIPSSQAMCGICMHLPRSYACGGQQRTSGFFLYHFRQGLLSEPDTWHSLFRLLWLAVIPGHLPVWPLCPQSWVNRHMWPCLAFKQVLGISIGVLMLHGKGSYLLTQFPGPITPFLTPSLILLLNYCCSFFHYTLPALYRIVRFDSHWTNENYLWAYYSPGSILGDMGGGAGNRNSFSHRVCWITE